MPEVPESHKDLLQAPVAVLATNSRDGKSRFVVTLEPLKYNTWG